MQMAIPKLNSVLLHYFENCVGCGVCDHSSPYYNVDIHYSPVEKSEFLREILRKKYTIAGKILGPLVGAKLPKNEKDMQRVMEFAYRCADCGHCYITCPFGIYSGAMVIKLREFLYNSGFAPTLLKELSTMEKSGEYATRARGIWEEFLSLTNAPVEKKGARVLLFVSLGDILLSKDAVVNTIEILKKVGEDFTLPGKPLGIFPPVGYTIGDRESVKTILTEIVNYIEKLNPQIVAIINGCFTYPHIRFEATNILKKKFAFKVVHITELLAEYMKQGKLKLKKLNIKVTLQDSCQLARRGGVVKEPYILLESCANVLRVKESGEDVMCLGGGAGIGILTKNISGVLTKALNLSINPPAWESLFLERLEKDYEKATIKRIEELKKADGDVVLALCPIALEALKRGGLKAEHFVTFIAKAIE